MSVGEREPSPQAKWRAWKKRQRMLTREQRDEAAAERADACRALETPGVAYVEARAAWRMDYLAAVIELGEKLTPQELDARVLAIKMTYFPFLYFDRSRLPATIDPESIR